jgi:putative FmdB family regulatory protein
MPVYEYKCTDCSRRFELFVQQRAMSDSVVCRHCHSPKIKKLVSTFASVGGGDESSSDSNTSSGCGGCSGGSCGSCGCH